MPTPDRRARPAATPSDGLAVGIWGRHELYVSPSRHCSTARGADVPTCATTTGSRRARSRPCAAVESPLPSELERAVRASAPPVIVLAELRRPRTPCSARALGRTRWSRRTPRSPSSRSRSSDARGDRALGCRSRPHRDASVEVLRLLAEGLDNAQIAVRLGISQSARRERTSRACSSGSASRTAPRRPSPRCKRGLARLCLAADDLRRPAGRGQACARRRGRSLAHRRAPRSCVRSAAPRAPGSPTHRRGEQLVARNAERGPDAGIGRRSCSPPRPRSSASARDAASARPCQRKRPARTKTARSTATSTSRASATPRSAAPALSGSRARFADAGIQQCHGQACTGTRASSTAGAACPRAGFRMSPWVGPLSALSFNSGTLRGFGGGFQPDPPRFVAQRLRAALVVARRRGHGQAFAGQAPADASPICVAVRSPALATLVRHTNQVSDNYFAETLLKGLGARFGGAGLDRRRRRGRERVRDAASGRRSTVARRLRPLARQRDLPADRRAAAAGRAGRALVRLASTARCRSPATAARSESACAEPPPAAAAAPRPGR